MAALAAAEAALVAALAAAAAALVAALAAAAAALMAVLTAAACCFGVDSGGDLESWASRGTLGLGRAP